MFKNYSTVKLVLSIALISIMVIACQQKPTRPVNPKLEKLKLSDGFRAEHVYSPSENDQGSWVAMTFDNKGRLITSDQYGGLFRLEISPIGDSTKPKIEKLVIGTPESQSSDTTTLKIGMGYAQGLLYAFNSLYVMVNHNSDKNFDKVEKLTAWAEERVR